MSRGSGSTRSKVPPEGRAQPGSGVGCLGLAELVAGGRLVFGVGRIHHLRSRKERLDLLRFAVDCGFQEFDVAPAYGNGLAERALGEVLSRTQLPVRVNSKVGIPVRIYPAWSDGCFPFARAADVLTGGHRRAYVTRDFRSSTVRQSVEASLRRLRREALDTCFLHEPLHEIAAPAWEDVVAELMRLQDAGKLLRWGVAGPSGLYGGVGKLPAEAIVQHPAEERFAPTASSPVNDEILYGVFHLLRTSHPDLDFSELVHSLAAERSARRMIVSTTSVDRLARWCSEPAR